MSSSRKCYHDKANWPACDLLNRLRFGFLRHMPLPQIDVTTSRFAREVHALDRSYEKLAHEAAKRNGRSGTGELISTTGWGIPGIAQETRPVRLLIIPDKVMA